MPEFPRLVGGMQIFGRETVSEEQEKTFSGTAAVVWPGRTEREHLMLSAGHCLGAHGAPVYVRRLDNPRALTSVGTVLLNLNSRSREAPGPDIGIVKLDERYPRDKIIARTVAWTKPNTGSVQMNGLDETLPATGDPVVLVGSKSGRCEGRVERSNVDFNYVDPNTKEARVLKGAFTVKIDGNRALVGGDSGSAVIRNGKFLGVYSGYTPSDPSLYYCIPVKAIAYLHQQW